ncbi:glycosyltransferase family 1 protein [Paenibacillus sp. HJGM_3]|uniref:glycosyltransferase family 1 protein n=1 Tax=Paenibacillus sp. HJGM_3 TaxID=3379816 RepID=UPI00385A5F32
MDRGGLETFIMNTYRKVNRSKVQFDFLMTRQEVGDYDEEIISLGGMIHNLPHISTIGYINYRRIVKQFFETHPEYNIVHCHMNTWSGFFLPIAKKYGVPVRIAHSHSTKNSTQAFGGYIGYLYKQYNKLFINRSATDLFACSNKAGEWLFGKKASFLVINNGIDSEGYKFNEKIRSIKRKSLCDNGDTYIIGHVGGFREPKNHEFLIDIFKKIYEKNENSLLCLVGEGELRSKIEKKVDVLGLKHAVKFLGVRNDVNELMQAFDVFLFPSIYEGLGMVIIEAQASNLPSVVSASIPREVDIGSGLIEFISLQANTEKWADTVLRKKEKYNRTLLNPNNLLIKGYDSQYVADKLQRFYVERSV